MFTRGVVTVRGVFTTRGDVEALGVRTVGAVDTRGAVVARGARTLGPDNRSGVRVDVTVRGVVLRIDVVRGAVVTRGVVLRVLTAVELRSRPDRSGNVMDRVPVLRVVTVRGDFVVRGDVVARGPVVVRGDVVARGLVVVRGDVVARGLVVVRGDVVARGLVVVRGDVFARGKVVTRGESVDRVARGAVVVRVLGVVARGEVAGVDEPRFAVTPRSDVRTERLEVAERGLVAGKLLAFPRAATALRPFPAVDAARLRSVR